MMKKISCVSFSDVRGGAAKAACRQVESIRENCSHYFLDYLVAEKKSNNPFVKGPSRLEFYAHFVLRVISLAITKFQVSDNVAKYSLNIFSSSYILRKLDMKSDVIHLHWFNNDTISINALKIILERFNGKVIITLHDDWFFCGAEHSSLESTRYKDGYLTSNFHNKGIDLDRWTFERKLKLKYLFNRKNVTFSAPSQWMTAKAKESVLLADANVVYVPNIIDSDVFQPFSKVDSRKTFGIDISKKIIAFGAVGGEANPLKGYDLLIKALDKLRIDKVFCSQIELLIFGGPERKKDILCGFNVTHVGTISDMSELAKVYSSADLVIVPSRMESFGQVAAESMSCSTPVISFDNSGVAEVVNGGLSDFTVRAFDTDGLSEKIHSFFSKSIYERGNIGAIARNSIKQRYSPVAIAKMWDCIYASEN